MNNNVSFENALSAADNIAYLAACMVDGKKPDAERISGMDLEKLYYVAEIHKMAGMLWNLPASVTLHLSRRRERPYVRSFFLILSEGKSLRNWKKPEYGICLLRDVCLRITILRLA